MKTLTFLFILLVLSSTTFAKTCTSVMIDVSINGEGWPVGSLSLCNQIKEDEACAIQVLEARHRPELILNCIGADPVCSQTLLELDYAPRYLEHCKEIDGECAKEKLLKGHHPIELTRHALCEL